MADRIVVMNAGAHRAGRHAPSSSTTAPANRFVAEFIGRMNVLRLTAGRRGGLACAASRCARRRAGSGGPDRHPARGRDRSAARRPDAGIRVTGVIEKAVFLGNFTRVTLELADQTLLVELRGRRRPPRARAALDVCLPREAIHRPARGADAHGAAPASAVAARLRSRPRRRRRLRRPGRGAAARCSSPAPLSSILRMSFDTPTASASATTSATSAARSAWTIVGNSLAVAADHDRDHRAARLRPSPMRCTAPRCRCKSVFGLVALLPLFAPSLVQALGILFLLGRNGIINRTFDLGIDIYGFWGIVIADVFYSFPHAYLILSAALAVADARLYESAHDARAPSPARIFRDITLPSTKYGLMSATFVVFTIVITDFGNPMVIGGDYSVLATEIYNQVLGPGEFRARRGDRRGAAGAGGARGDRREMDHAPPAPRHRRPVAPARDAPEPARDRPDARPMPCWCARRSCRSSASSSSRASCQLWPYNMHVQPAPLRFEVQNGHRSRCGPASGSR